MHLTSHSRKHVKHLGDARHIIRIKWICHETVQNQTSSILIKQANMPFQIAMMLFVQEKLPIDNAKFLLFIASLEEEQGDMLTK